MHIKLPEHIEESEIEFLITLLAEYIERLTLNCNLQPTTRAALLAAEAAVCVLLAHEIGQEANSDLAAVQETQVDG